MNDGATKRASLPIGIYDQLVTHELRAALDALPSGWHHELAPVDPEESHTSIAQLMERMIRAALGSLRGKERARKQHELVSRLASAITTTLDDSWAPHAALPDTLERLHRITGSSTAPTPPRPETPLRHSYLLTGSTHDPSLSSQLKSEIANADRVDILCSFIKWSGLRLLLPDLEQLTAEPSPDGPRLRVISTSYMGATDPGAIERLLRLPNTEIKVSYDTKRTRLHAKAYTIHRQTGFGCSYIGSANLSHAALSDGLEWTTKVAEFELPHVWQQIAARFQSYWHDDAFEPYDESRIDKLRSAIADERSPATSPFDGFIPDVKPYSFQEEILEAIALERSTESKKAHLIVSATGTGKTMIAAFDYRRQAGGSRPTLLFIAHREEILKQARAAFRTVLRDQNFGDLVTGRESPSQNEHLFCTIQSYSSRGMDSLPADHFDYVVVDEFHHAAAKSYRALLDRVTPETLLGLTATPERADGLDILGWFGGTATATIRLADAINQQLLCPFQYFGVTDHESVDLSMLSWQRGGYRTQDLDRLISSNEERASLVHQKVAEYLLNPLDARGLGFCVSVAHAEFMAQYFSDHGIPSIALSAKSTPAERSHARTRLVERQINFIFVVDLYNEGVDIPEVDTVLFLRPTESLTVYLQQLGRGLRLHESKTHLTVLDFVGVQHRKFNLASRFLALGSDPTVRLTDEITHGFPHLPAGCSIQLERVATQRVLDHIRSSLRSMAASDRIEMIRSLSEHLDRTPTLYDATTRSDTTADRWFAKTRIWSHWLHEAKCGPAVDDPDLDVLHAGLRRMSQQNDLKQIAFLMQSLHAPRSGVSRTPLEVCRLSMMHAVLWGTKHPETFDDAVHRLRRNPRAEHDLLEVLEVCRHRSTAQPHALDESVTGPLSLHSSYSRDEILIALGYWSFDHRPRFTEGVLHIPDRRLDAFFVTLQKSESEYSATTMYEDYVISRDLVHWQSQSTTASHSPTGRRYVEHRELGYSPLLFVRKQKKLAGGLTSPYAYLGPAEYVSHTGDRPMSIEWRLRTPMTASLFNRFRT